MKFPWILRSDHNEIVRQQNVILCDREDTIARLTEYIRYKEAEIEVLSANLTKAPVPERAADIVKRGPLPLLGRSAWRARAQQISKSTAPVPKDSAKALEQKVVSEGGTI
jgi:hypothetical protein